MEFIEQELDWRLLRAASRYLAKNPPVHLLVKWFMGIKSDDLPGATTPADAPARKQNFVDAFRAAGGSIH